MRIAKHLESLSAWVNFHSSCQKRKNEAYYVDDQLEDVGEVDVHEEESGGVATNDHSVDHRVALFLQQLIFKHASVKFELVSGFKLEHIISSKIQHKINKYLFEILALKETCTLVFCNTRVIANNYYFK